MLDNSQNYSKTYHDKCADLKHQALRPKHRPKRLNHPILNTTITVENKANTGLKCADKVDFKGKLIFRDRYYLSWPWQASIFKRLEST